jgi:hypothetical protein
MVSNTSGKTNDGGPYLKPWGGLGARNGTVYVIDGTSGGQFGFWNGEHPAFFYKTLDYGSLVIDVVSNRLDAIFLRDTGAIDDSFTDRQRQLHKRAAARDGNHALRIKTW